MEVTAHPPHLLYAIYYAASEVRELLCYEYITKLITFINTFHEISHTYTTAL
jgi:hypothetical protein